MTPLWYALQSKPRKEDVLWRQMVSEGLEVFYPRLPVSPVNPRSRRVVPYFPGYMFVLLDLSKAGRTLFQWLPGAVGLVCCGDTPIDVPAALIEAIRAQIEVIEQAGGFLLHQLKTGDPVVIQSGPFAGYEAMFDTRISGSGRVRVLLAMLNDHYVPLELEVGYLAPRHSRGAGC